MDSETVLKPPSVEDTSDEIPDRFGQDKEKQEGVWTPPNGFSGPSLRVLVEAVPA